MSAIVEKVRDLISKGHLDYAILDFTIELDARVKELKDSLKEHREWHRVGGLIPKPTKEEHYDILHEGLKHMAGIDAKPTPTDEELVIVYLEKLRLALRLSNDDYILNHYFDINTVLRQLIKEVRS